jgi:hypothetical protein
MNQRTGILDQPRLNYNPLRRIAVLPSICLRGRTIGAEATSSLKPRRGSSEVEAAEIRRFLVVTGLDGMPSEREQADSLSLALKIRRSRPFRGLAAPCQINLVARVSDALDRFAGWMAGVKNAWLLWM